MKKLTPYLVLFALAALFVVILNLGSNATDIAQAQAAIEAARAAQDAAKAAQIASGGLAAVSMAQSIALTLALVALLGVIGLGVYVAYKSQSRPAPRRLARGEQPVQVITGQQPAQLSQGDPMSQLVQLMVLRELREMGSRPQVQAHREDGEL